MLPIRIIIQTVLPDDPLAAPRLLGLLSESLGSATDPMTAARYPFAIRL